MNGNKEHINTEPGRMPSDYSRRAVFVAERSIRDRHPGRLPQARGIKVTLTVAQAQAAVEALDGAPVGHHMVKVARRKAREKVAHALGLWLEYRPKKGNVIGVVRDERLRLLRMKHVAFARDVAKRAADLGHKLSEANVSDIERGRSRHPQKSKLLAYCAATGIPWETVLRLLPVNNKVQMETRPVALPAATWAAIDAEEEPLDEVLSRLYGKEEE